MAASGTCNRKPPATLRTLWAIAKSPELLLTSDDLHAVVFRETGKDSLKKLSQREIATVARVLQVMKDRAGGRIHPRRTDEGGNPKTVNQRRKIYALCAELGWNDDNRRINGFVKRMCGAERIEWLNMAQCNIIIEALKQMAQRQEGGAHGGSPKAETPLPEGKDI